MSTINPGSLSLQDKAVVEIASRSPQKQGLDPEARPDALSESKERRLLLSGRAVRLLLLCLAFLAGSLFISPALIATSVQAASAQEAIQDSAVASVELAETQRMAWGLGQAQALAHFVIVTPTIGPITFAPEISPQGEPVQPTVTFEAGITQTRALFEYANLSPDHFWTQIWYYNGDEVFSTSQPWLANEAGQYDYLIEAGGEPLPAGEWTLEFYINGQFMTDGSFSVEAEAEPLENAETPDLDDIPRIYKLAYTKWNGEKHDLYLGDSLGSREQFILGRAAGPSWAPDGSYIYFYGEEGVDNQIINGTLYPLPGATNGIVRINITPVPANISQVKLFQGHGWNDGTARVANVAPDGAMIAYDGDRGGGRRIYFLGTAANQQFRIEIIGEQADWSPDSQRIVYRSGRNNQTGLWISNRNDSGHIRITGGGTDSFPAWSPDGQTIAFSREAGGNVDIYTVNVDGSNLQRLTDTAGHDTLPVYLPDGELVFRSARGGRWSIWKMSGDGSNQTQIVANAPVGPDWTFSRIGVLR